MRWLECELNEGTPSRRGRYYECQGCGRTVRRRRTYCKACKIKHDREQAARDAEVERDMTNWEDRDAESNE